MGGRKVKVAITTPRITPKSTPAKPRAMTVSIRALCFE